MNAKQMLASWLMVFFMYLALFSCASAPVEALSEPGNLGNDVYAGNGTAPTLGQAMGSAIADALKKAVVDLAGSAVEIQAHNRLADLIYGMSTQNQFIYRDSIQTGKRGSKDGGYGYELTVKVNKKALENALAQAGLLPGSGPVALVDPVVGNGASVDSSPVISPKQRAFIKDALDRLDFMVYYKESPSEDPKLLLAGVAQANSWLAEKGYNLVDFATIEKLKKESRLIYETQRGENLSPIDWIAQDQGADILLELDISTTAKTEGKSHIASSNMTINIKDPSIGQLLGSLPVSNPPVQSVIDQYDARFRSIVSGVSYSLPQAVEQSRVLLAKQLVKGVRYTIELQKTPDAKTTIDFRSKLKQNENVVSVKELSKTKAVTKMEIYFFGTADDLEELAFNAASMVSGLENFDAVMKKGKSLVFDTGM